MLVVGPDPAPDLEDDNPDNHDQEQNADPYRPRLTLAFRFVRAKVFGNVRYHIYSYPLVSAERGLTRIRGSAQDEQND